MKKPKDTLVHDWSGNIPAIVGDPFCVASDDGEKVYDLVSKALDLGKNVVLSFEGIEALSSAFLNSAIGQLLGKYSRQELQNRLRTERISPDDELLLKRVIENAERYFKNPQKFDQQRDSALFLE